MLINHIKTARRNLIRNKMYAAINISGIAIGMAAFWLIAMYVADEISFDRSFKNADRIYRITQHATWDEGNVDLPLNPPPLGPALTQNFPEVEQSIRIDAEAGGVIKFNEKVIKQNDIVFADNSFFQVFDYKFIDGDPGSVLSQPNSIVITKTLAEKIFGNASSAFNKIITIDNSADIKITGVIEDVPANSHLQFAGIRPMYTISNDLYTWQNFYLYHYILLKKGTDIAAFEKKLNAFGMQTIAKEMGVSNYHMELQPISSIHLHSNLPYELSNNSSISRVYIFSAIGILILLIALINYMNLATARSAVRVKEIGIRKVVGSSTINVASLFMAEAFLVTLSAALMSVGIVKISLPFFNALSGKTLDIWRFGAIPTIGFILLFAFLSGLLSGSYPAVFLSRFKMIPSLKGQLGNMHTSVLLRKTLVVFQFVIAVFLISGSFIIYKQLQYVNNKDLGFNKSQVIVCHIDDTKVRNEIPALKAALLQHPAIESVGIAGNKIGDNYLGGHDFSFEINGAIGPSSTMAKQLYVDEDFLKTMGIELLQGRSFDENMTTDRQAAMIINETLMKQLGYTNAVGKKSEYRINRFSETSHRNIIGVIKDFHFSSLQHKIEPMVLMLPPVASEQDNLFVRIAKGKVATGLNHIKTTYSKFDKQHTADFTFIDEAFAKQYAAEKKQEQLSFVFTMLAFIIACLGLTGLVIFTTTQRVKEIGIRKVLGASAASVTMMLGKSFMQLVLIASVIAIPVAWFAMNKWLQEFAYRIHIRWWMLMIPGVIGILTALLTVCAQAMKAAFANPVKSLRTE